MTPVQAVAVCVAGVDAAYAGRRLEFAHRAIDTFLALTGLTEHTPDPARTAAAVTAMTAQR